MKNHTISVVIPVKNAEKTIGRCLEAIFSQSYPPLEVLVIDGNSVDMTVENALKFPVRIIYENYGTVGGARQVGLENSQGYFIAFTDADCIPENDWLENLVNEFNGDFVGVGGSINNIGKGIWEKSIALVANTFLGSANSVQGRVFKEKRVVNSISGSNSMYLKKALLQVGGFNIKLSVNEETELNKRLKRIGKLLYTPTAAVLHDQNRGLTDFAKRIYHFGLGRGKLRLWDLQCVPPLCLILLIASLLFSKWLLIGTFSLYLLILILTGLKFAFSQKRISYGASVPAVYLVEHFSYSFGFLIGLFNI